MVLWSMLWKFTKLPVVPMKNLALTPPWEDLLGKNIYRSLSGFGGSFGLSIAAKACTESTIYLALEKV